MIDIILKYIYFFILPTFFLVYGLRLMLGNRSQAQRVLGLYFISFFIRNISAYFLAEQNVSFYIHFHNIQSPIHYLFGPLSFLFCLYALKPFRKFKWYDVLHFLPFLLHVIELLPFWFGPTANKFKDLELARVAGSLVNYPSISGIIPIRVHITIKGILYLIYLICSVLLWFRYAKKKQSFFFKNNSILINWIGIDLLFKIISVVFITLQARGKFNIHHTSTFSPNDLLMFMDVLVNFVFFVFYPKLLNGVVFETISFDNFNHLKGRGDDTMASSAGTKKSKDNRFIQQMQVIMEVDAPFLDENFSIKILASQLNITERNLSKLIHENFQMSFPDFVGNYRLNYLKKILKEKEGVSNLTIEKLAEKSGFGSRQALYKVVQRLHNTTPNKYFDVK
ncbi:MAG: hypothetical protein RJA76_658 [Bacteroidota bacterium]|jgi:AraC-like DNA-binding protein